MKDLADRGNCFGVFLAACPAPLIRLRQKGVAIMAPKIKKSVWGIYPTRLALEGAIAGLRENGFLSSDISVLLPENLGPKDLVTEKSTKAPEGATTGAGSGVLIGGALGWLAGIGALALPGLGPFIAAGPLMASLAGLGVGGVIGGITGALIGAGIPEYEAKRYEGRLMKGSILVSVHCDKHEEIEHAKEIMERTGGDDISVAAEEPAPAIRGSV
jgi:hypothetical protein